jgi:hypothetical protein
MPDPQTLFSDDDDASLPRPCIVVAALDLPEDGEGAKAETSIRMKALDLSDNDTPAAAPSITNRHDATVAGTPVVQALDLSSDLQVAVAKILPATVAFAITTAEHPLVAKAMSRGEILFPDLMNESGFLVRNRLGELLPLDFARLSIFGADTVMKAGDLVSAVTALDERFNRIDAERILAVVLSRAKAHAGLATSLLGRLTAHVSFDIGAARIQIGSVRDALMSELGVIDETADAACRVNGTLRTEVAALTILEDMGDHGPMGEILARRSSLIQVSLRETALALKQIGNIRSLAEQWIMRSDELRDVTLPALGFSKSL